MTTTPMTEPEKLDLRSEDIAKDKRDELLQLFPEVRTEGGKIDFDRLKLALGETVDVGRERYGMNWPGKAECFKTIQTPSLGTLRPCREESVNFDTTENLIIEGDNLEVLKLLQKSYLGKVKMIYIDPPYNTGNDFIYPDNYTESLQTYLEYTGQVDSEGRRFGTNAESDGRFHSNWLNMMYPRLYLARNLLRTDGVVFVSIDDHEVATLRLLCNEIFGEENFVANVIWQKKYTRSNDAKYFSDNHDHILVFARDKNSFVLNLQERSTDQTAAYANPDNHPKGPWKATPLHAKSGTESGFTYTFKNRVTWSPPPGTYPRYSIETLARLDRDDELWFGIDGNATPSRKTFLSEAKTGVTPITIWPYDEVGHNHEANNELKALDLPGVFDNPKPTRLIRRMLQLATQPSDNDIVLDFFAGSGTTAHAVLAENESDHGNRRFILIQLPEPTGRQDYRTIADIAKERTKRVISALTANEIGRLAFDARQSSPLGYRLFTLARSNFAEWNARIDQNEERLVKQLELHVDHLRSDRTVADLFYEILLKSGFQLSTQVEEITLAGKTVYSVAGGAFLISLERELTLTLIRAIADRKPERVVCLDEGFAGNDQLKANAVQTFRTKGITSFKTV